MTVYADLLRYRDLFANLFRRDLQAKYKGSALGVLWTLANPLLLMAIYLVIFSTLWKARFAQLDHYPLFLLTGLAPWVFFSTALQSASRSMLDNANLIKKTRFPRQLVPLSVVAAHLVSFAVMLGLLLALDFVLLPRVRATEWLALPLAALLLCVVGGLALAVASLNVVFRDVEHIVAALLLPWFFLTPIIYPLRGVAALDRHPHIVTALHWLNPLSAPIQAIRDPLFFGRLPRLADALYLLVAAIVALALGAFVFTSVDDQLAVEL
ncbi:MAG TPA: ABC transporter permease [Gaiellaceae bacterium]|jgi:ABC-type polysaccharide/polyol phosphate export permease|nr:ABC transporter permease [Gaiellaceae bacterium]